MLCAVPLTLGMDETFFLADLNIGFDCGAGRAGVGRHPFGGGGGCDGADDGDELEDGATASTEGCAARCCVGAAGTHAPSCSRMSASMTASSGLPKASPTKTSRMASSETSSD